jgi:hypothetical protein
MPRLHIAIEVFDESALKQSELLLGQYFLYKASPRIAPVEKAAVYIAAARRALRRSRVLFIIYFSIYVWGLASLTARWILARK